VYFGLVASRFTRVNLVGVVGHDGEASARKMLAGADVDLSGLAVADGPSYRWRATHDFERWVTADEESRLGVLETWEPRVPPAAAAAPVVFVGSMAPVQQLAVLSAVPSARVVGADSMTVHIRAAPDAVRLVAESADVLFGDRAEVCLLTGSDESTWMDGARSLCGRGRLRAVVVKSGPDGAVCVTRDAVVSRAAHPVDFVVDPTGAGDSLAAGFLGVAARAERDPLDDIEASLDAGVRCAASVITAFGVDGLRGIP